MGERIDASLSEPVHRLIEKALTSKVPIAELIGFGVEALGGGRAVASLRSGPQHANPMGRFTAVCCATMSNVMLRIRRANTSRRHARPASSYVARTRGSVDLLCGRWTPSD
jgi:hypothetical protein